MFSRRLFAWMLVGSLVGFSGLSVAQDKKDPPKKDKDAAKIEQEKKETPKKEPEKKREIVPVEPVDQSFKSADGVTLIGKWYKNPKGASSVVLLLHDYKANPTEAVWEDTAQQLVSYGYHVFRFDFRGHGKSTDVKPNEFWQNPVNKNLVKSGGVNLAVKSSIKFTEFYTNYYPMLVQDIAAARNVIDLLNDVKELNSSTVYLLGAGDAAYLGMLYISSEWLRESEKPNMAYTREMVSPRVGLFQNAQSAGPDIAGAIWLSPTRNTGITNQNVKDWTLSPHAIRMRNETPMLFIHGAKDTKSTQVSKYLANEALAIKLTNYNGVAIPKVEQTFVREIKDSAATGTKLLGNNLGTEDMIEKFLTAVDKERKNKVNKTRSWTSPIYIDVQSFGVCKPQ